MKDLNLKCNIVEFVSDVIENVFLFSFVFFAILQGNQNVLIFDSRFSILLVAWQWLRYVLHLNNKIMNCFSLLFHAMTWNECFYSLHIMKLNMKIKLRVKKSKVINLGKKDLKDVGIYDLLYAPSNFRFYIK